jgi:hypothetical protein
MLADETFQVGELTFGDGSDRFGQVEDGRIRQAIENEQAFLAAVDQGRLSKRLQMLRRVGEGQAHLGRKGINCSLPLGQELENLQTTRTREGLADAGKLTVQAVLELPVPILDNSQVINILLDYRPRQVLF